jgi:hypothetical protein
VDGHTNDAIELLLLPPRPSYHSDKLDKSKGMLRVPENGVNWQN